MLLLLVATCSGEGEKVIARGEVECTPLGIDLLTAIASWNVSGDAGNKGAARTESRREASRVKELKKRR